MVLVQTLDKTRAWLEVHRLADTGGSVALAGMTRLASYRIPPDSGVKTALSREIVALVLESDESCLLWIDEYGIWPSAEDMVLFDGFRESLGERAHLREKPGHVAGPQDTGALRSLTALVMYFAWGAYLVGESGGVIVRISHDEMLDLYVREGHVIAAQALNVLGEICKTRGGPPAR